MFVEKEVLMDDCSLLLLLLLLFSLSVILLFSIRSGVPVSEEWLSMSHESKELLLSISLLFEPAEKAVNQERQLFLSPVMCQMAVDIYSVV
jgi:hypothetical protein